MSRKIDINKASYKQLESYIRNEGKKANQRLVQLKKSGYDQTSNAYRHIETLSYFDDKNQFKTSKSGNLGFNVSIRALTKGLTKQQAQARLRAQASLIKGFINAKTSTVSGINKAYEKASKTLSKEVGQNVNVRELGEIFRVVNEKGIQIGSNVVIELYTKYTDQLTTSDIVNAMNNSIGLSQNDIELGIKEKILIKDYYGEISASDITEIVRDNRTLDINDLKRLIEDLIKEQEEIKIF